MKLILKYAVIGILIPVYFGGFGVLAEMKVQASPAISCKKKIVAIGQPNRIESVANLNAIGAWISRAQERGKDYAQWLVASKTSVNCEKRDHHNSTFVAPAANLACLDNLAVQSNISQEIPKRSFNLAILRLQPMVIKQLK